MSRTTTRLAVAAAAAFGLVTIALPASAADSSYSPGDVVTVDGASVVAPAAGHSVAISVDRLTGSTILAVTTSADGTVTVSNELPGMSEDSVPAAPNKCSDSAFSYSPYNGASWPGSYNWRIKTNSIPNELTKKQATGGLKTSVKNITGANNDCGMADQVSAKASYKGSTTSSSDVTAGLQCNAQPNMKNVTEFGPINTDGVLAATCTYSTGAGGDIGAASVRINTGYKWWVSGGCTSAIGLKATMTHEYGHAFGMGHVDEANHGNLTMSTNINSDCSNFEASLGRGDVLGLNGLY
jgi:hypothetical protein